MRRRYHPHDASGNGEEEEEKAPVSEDSGGTDADDPFNKNDGHGGIVANNEILSPGAGAEKLGQIHKTAAAQRKTRSVSPPPHIISRGTFASSLSGGTFASFPGQTPASVASSAAAGNKNDNGNNDNDNNCRRGGRTDPSPSEEEKVPVGGEEDDDVIHDLPVESNKNLVMTAKDDTGHGSYVETSNHADESTAQYSESTMMALSNRTLQGTMHSRLPLRSQLEDDEIQQTPTQQPKPRIERNNPTANSSGDQEPEVSPRQRRYDRYMMSHQQYRAQLSPRREAETLSPKQDRRALLKKVHYPRSSQYQQQQMRQYRRPPNYFRAGEEISDQYDSNPNHPGLPIPTRNRDEPNHSLQRVDNQYSQMRRAYQTPNNSNHQPSSQATRANKSPIPSGSKSPLPPSPPRRYISPENRKALIREDGNFRNLTSSRRGLGMPSPPLNLPEHKASSQQPQSPTNAEAANKDRTVKKDTTTNNDTNGGLKSGPPKPPSKPEEPSVSSAVYDSDTELVLNDLSDQEYQQGKSQINAHQELVKQNDQKEEKKSRPNLDFERGILIPKKKKGGKLNQGDQQDEEAKEEVGVESNKTVPLEGRSHNYHEVECQSCQERLRVTKTAIVVQCPSCEKVSPATSIASIHAATKSS